jgi:hypothetical protein
MLAKLNGYWKQNRVLILATLVVFTLVVATLTALAVGQHGLVGFGVALLVSTLSLDFTLMIDIAFQIINALWPLFVVPMGFMFGLRLLNWIMSEIRDSITK